MEKTRNTGTIKSLSTHYYIHVTVIAALLALVLFRVIDLSRYAEFITVTAERYAILVTIIAIPVALKTFSERLKKVSKGSINRPPEKEYARAYFIRLYSVGIVTVANIVLFSCSRNHNFLWLTIVLLIIYFFCKPSDAELIALTDTEKEAHEDA
ncbi:MAG TPA: hypothetical protein DDZ96_11100 [Porphyromonadaceae bacterium]|jgi:hypothetical protein|nr:hypothetical protein [Porphyromonadaceae bacterium]HBL34346.1 hypothetical protein [Porphyromonadaceae bacterium]HBX20190.1 hypothetical protein [Porphyromonadaceae bacterium]HCM19983.1 hypothetical protein [Porphyromonadaceae bacterium]